MLIDSASLENHHKTARNSGGHNSPKTFWVSVWCISNQGVPYYLKYVYEECLHLVAINKGIIWQSGPD